MSTSRMMTVSIQPPKNPASMPSEAPMMPPTKMPTSEMVSETRAPYMMRLRMSRPIRSVPSGYFQVPPKNTGGCRRSLTEPCTGSCGASQVGRDRRDDQKHQQHERGDERIAPQPEPDAPGRMLGPGGGGRCPASTVNPRLAAC